MKPDRLPRLLTSVALLGNGLFLLWILYNGINEGFQGTVVEKASFAALLVLLVLNIVVIAGRARMSS